MAGTSVIADIYVRISKARDGSMLGVERQEPPSRALLKQLGWTLGKVITDNDTSAFNEKPRRGFVELLSRQRQGIANAVAALDTDRLAVLPRDYDVLIELAEQLGTRIATVTGSEFDFTLLDEQLTFRLKGLLAWRERQQMRLRAKMKHDELGRAGKFSGYRRAFGYDLEGIRYQVEKPDGTKVTRLAHCKLVINQAEAGEIRAAVAKLLKGRTTISAIQTDWNKRGVRRAEGGLWYTRNIRDLLTNPRIAGLRRWHGELVEAEWEAIIGREDWERVCLILENPAPDPRRGRRGPPPTTYLLTGRLGECECGTPISGHGTRGVRYYRCSLERGGCGGITRLAVPIEDFVRDAVLEAFGDPHRGGRLRRALARQQADDSDLRALLAERKAWEARLAKLEQEKIAGDYDEDPDQFQRLNSGIRAGLAKVQQQLDARPIRTGLPVEIPEGAEAARAAWEEWTIDERRAVVAFALKKVIFKKGFRGQKFHHSQLKLDWRV
jgi:DNA invertase Pin-like site-specific DNA recombinase